MAKRKMAGKRPIAIVITGLVFLLITGFHLLGVFHFLEYKSYDMRVRFWANSGYSRPSDEIIVILLDQASINWAQQERQWGFPWPRQAYSEIIDYMKEGGAKSIVFDILFSEPSVYRNARQDEIIDNAVRSLEEAEQEGEQQTRPETTGRQQRAGVAEGRSSDQPRTSRQINRTIINALRSLSAREDDASFINASKNYGRVVQAVFFSSQTGENYWPGIDIPLFQTENFGSMLEKFSVGPEDEKAQFPIHGLTESAGALGSATGLGDSDGIIRRLKPFTLFNDRAVPGLSSASLIASGKDRRIYFNKKNNTVEWDGITIPVDKKGNALLRYKGRPGEGGSLDVYNPYSAGLILRSAEAYRNNDLLYMENEGLLPPENFKDAYVFVGYYAPGLFDMFSTPVDPNYPGMGCHITMLDNMLQGDFIRESAQWLNLLILFAVVVLIVYLAMFSNRISLSVAGTVIIVALIIVTAFVAYQWGGLWLPMITFLAGTLAAFVTVTLYNYATEGSQKRFIKSAFSQYLSPKVIEQIIQDPSQLKLGGEKREMTAIFTDIRSFSTISEALGDPAKLVELLNFYLTRMSNIVLENQGTIDKYEGDAIIAFFGAPIHFDNHASLACRAVVKMKKAEAEINREALEQGLVTPEVMKAMTAKGIIASIDDPYPLFTRLGVNTGDMVVGNMGTPSKMDYTIMGNAVNLAARLEGVNKQYDTGGILISEYTRAHIGDEFVLRPLSRVRVVGINTPLRLYELLDIAEEASPELLDMVKKWEQAFSFYEKREFLAAQNIFKTICAKNDGDLAAKKYLKRCEKYLASPPDEKVWDNGVDNLTEK